MYLKSNQSKPYRRLLILDYQDTFVNTVHQIVKGELEIDIIAHVSTGMLLIKRLRESYTEIDLILLGTAKGKCDRDSMIYARYIRRYFPKIRIIIVSLHKVGAYILNMYNNGILGYLFRNFHSEELQACIASVSQGEKYYQGEVKACMEAHQRHIQPKEDIDICLTDKEKFILQWMEQGIGLSEISRLTDMREKSVFMHWKSITRKFETEDRATIIQMASNQGLLEEVIEVG